MKHTASFLQTHLLTAFLCVSLLAGAQDQKLESSKLLFKPGQKFKTENKVKSTSSMEMMGQQMDIKADVAVVRQLEIKEKKANAYTVISTITKMASTLDMMGQNMSYDSEKPADSAGEMGKVLSERINKPSTLEMNDEGKITSVKKQDSAGADMGGMSSIMKSFGAGGDETALTDDMFLLTPKNLKPGYAWNDSIIADGQKTFRNYIVKSMDGKKAVVTISGKMNTDKKMENQGMEMNLVMESNLSGEMTIDTTTGVIHQRTLTVEGSGNIDMMGGQMPMTTKVETTSVTTSL